MRFCSIYITLVCIACFLPIPKSQHNNLYNEDTTFLINLIFHSKEKTIYIPRKSNGQAYKINHSIALPSNRIIVLEKEVIIESMDTIGGIFLFQDCNNTILKGSGASLRQRRDSRRSMIYLLGGKNCQIIDLILEGAGKDGIYVGSGNTTGAGQDHVIQGCKISNMKRQGISIVDALRTKILDCYIENTNGAPPAAGIDLEENENTIVEYTLIKNCVFENNLEQAGILIAKASHTTITGCIFKNNKMGINLDLAGTGTRKIMIESIDSQKHCIKAYKHGLEVNDLVMLRPLKQTHKKLVSNHRYTFRVFEVIDENNLRLSYNYGARPVEFLSESKDYYLRKYELSELEFVNIQHCRFINNGASIYGEQARNVKVENCTIEGGYGGINLVNTANVVIHNNRLHNNTGGRAIYLTDENANITGNYIVNSKEEAIEIHGTKCTQIFHNTFVNCGMESNMVLYVKDIHQSIIAENTFIQDELLRYGVVLEGANNQVGLNKMKKTDYQQLYAGLKRLNIELRSENEMQDPCP